VTANGIRIHYLDWGGEGEPLLFLAGFTDTAHVFDDFAPKFTDRFHVLALTRRGFGDSEKPASGYDTRTRVEDIRGFLDAMQIDRASLVGHSIAGDELTLFATTYPQRVRKLVYLDAAYDDTERSKVGVNAPDIPPFMKRMLLEAHGSPDAASVVAQLPPPEMWGRFLAIIRPHLTIRPDYTKLAAPALAIYATSAHKPPSKADEATRRAIQEWYEKNDAPFTRASIEQFQREAAHGEVLEMKDADHYLFRGATADEAALRIKEFLLR
jgi:pimeloyl-ACP methyl ester carboxylesterase